MKTVLISGGSRGIGKACVEIFAKNGYKVAFIYKSSDACANSLVKECGALAIKADVSKANEVKRAFAEAETQLGGIDVIVNNTGISYIWLLQDMTDSEWNTLLSTNLSSAFYLCREAIPSMVRRQNGRIINIGSVWGKHGASCEAAYSATKSALRGLTLSLAKEIGPSGITVNCVEPGVIETDMNAHFDGQTLAQLKDETALCRLGKPEDVAEAVLFLASDKASFITGQFIGVDGGFPA